MRKLLLSGVEIQFSILIIFIEIQANRRENKDKFKTLNEQKERVMDNLEDEKERIENLGEELQEKSNTLLQAQEQIEILLNKLNLWKEKFQNLKSRNDENLAEKEKFAHKIGSLNNEIEEKIAIIRNLEHINRNMSLRINQFNQDPNKTSTLSPNKGNKLKPRKSLNYK